MNHSLYQDFLAQVFRRNDCRWPETIPQNGFNEYFIERVRRDGMLLVVHHRAAADPASKSWPAEVWHALEEAAKNDAIIDILRQQNLSFLVNALRQGGIEPVLLKGGALALTHYEAPFLRTRSDTDLLIPENSFDSAHKILSGHGFTAEGRIDGDYVNYQQVYCYEAPGGMKFLYDIHKKILNPACFSDALSYEGILEGSRSLPLFHGEVRVIGEKDALLHACMHRVAHHYEDRKLIWLYDIHLLLSGTDQKWREDFYRLAKEKKMTRVCGASFDLCRDYFGTVLQENWLSLFRDKGAAEPSARFLNKNQSRMTLLAGDLLSLKGWEAKGRLLRESFFPSPEYMRQKYGVKHGWSLPFFYIWRIVSGIPGAFKTLGS